jgi:hypothetical protein
MSSIDPPRPWRLQRPKEHGRRHIAERNRRIWAANRGRSPTTQPAGAAAALANSVCAVIRLLADAVLATHTGSTVLHGVRCGYSRIAREKFLFMRKHRRRQVLHFNGVSEKIWRKLAQETR